MKDILNGKKILFGITGSIAAYKTPLIIRELVKMGASVKVIMTPSAREFVTPITLTSVSRNNVLIDMFDLSNQNEGAWHIHLAHWCDLAIIAPCSATTLGKLANGIADNALVAVFMALPKSTPKLIAPAMDSDMLLFPATQKNINTLAEFGFGIIPPDEGELASGLSGPGRLPEINTILEYIKKYFIEKEKSKIELLDKPLEPLEMAIEKDKFQAELELTQMKNRILEEKLHNFYKDKKIIVTAGPTIEKIDPVRYITNASSGKMGYAIAEEISKYAKEVVLVSGPVNLPKPNDVRLINVQSAEDMHKALTEIFPKYDILIMAAAVADFTPKNKFDIKIKKSTSLESIELVPTPDILKEIGTTKRSDQIVVGFALETDNELDNAKKKIIEKNLDYIVLNNLNEQNPIFGSDENEVTIIDKSFNIYNLGKNKKIELSKKIIQIVAGTNLQ